MYCGLRTPRSRPWRPRGRRKAGGSDGDGGEALGVVDGGLEKDGRAATAELRAEIGAPRRVDAADGVNEASGDLATELALMRATDTRGLMLGG